MTNEAGDWDWDRLNGMLPQHILECIVAELPPRRSAGPDMPGWRLEERQNFTTKSAYGYLVERNDVTRRRVDSVESLWACRNTRCKEGMAKIICDFLFVSMEESLQLSIGIIMHASRGLINT
ncbi:hypothetical protein V6N11_058316 [Hibiscus sabdariffa]|uniref:Uncharacterized protein n=1 Tax=Hibiscus sabdariffa TaxID=183260 RepID=A0ABR2U3W4_9ROSI